MANSLKPILSSIDGSAVEGDGVSVAMQDDAQIVVMAGGSVQGCEPHIASPTADVGKLKAAESYALETINSVATDSMLSDEQIARQLSVRNGYMCEELRDPSHVSDYVSLADYSYTVGYKVYPMRTFYYNVIYDGTPVCTETVARELKPVRTMTQECKYVPIKEPLLTSRNKGDMVEVRIEYKIDPGIEGMPSIKADTTQRLYIKHRTDGCDYDDRMYVRYIYGNVPDVEETFVKATKTTVEAAEIAKTRFVRTGQTATETAPIGLVIISLRRTQLFMLGFNENRIVLYCLEPLISEYRITSCKAIHSAEPSS